MRPNITVLLVEDSPDFAELVQVWFAEKQDSTLSLNWTDTLAGALRRITRGGVDLVLMDLGLPDSDGFETFLRVRLHAPEIPIIVLSAADNEGLALRTVQEGAQDYLVKSSCTADMLVRAVRYALVRHKGAGPEAGGAGTRIVGVSNPCGGVGATTVACHLGVELAEQTAKKVLVTDFDMTRGMVSFLMRADSQYTVVDAIENIGNLDEEYWKGLVCKGLGDVDILKSPARVGAPEPSSEALIAVLSAAAPRYGWVVADLGVVKATSIAALQKMSEVLVVTSAEVSALYQTKRLIDHFLNSGLERHNIRLVLNHVFDGSSLSTNELEKMFGLQVYATLPYDLAGLREAQVYGRVLGKNSAFRVRIRELARKMAGLKEPKPRRWSLSGFRLLPGESSSGETSRPKANDSTPYARV